MAGQSVTTSFSTEIMERVEQYFSEEICPFCQTDRCWCEEGPKTPTCAHNEIYEDLTLSAENMGDLLSMIRGG